MIKKLDKKATIRLLVAIKIQAERDIKQYEKREQLHSEYVGKSKYQSACNYLKEELPVVREILGECFRDKNDGEN